MLIKAFCMSTDGGLGRSIADRDGKSISREVSIPVKTKHHDGSVWCNHRAGRWLAKLPGGWCHKSVADFACWQVGHSAVPMTRSAWVTEPMQSLHPCFHGHFLCSFVKDSSSWGYVATFHMIITVLLCWCRFLVSINISHKYLHTLYHQRGLSTYLFPILSCDQFSDWVPSKFLAIHPNIKHCIWIKVDPCLWSSLLSGRNEQHVYCSDFHPLEGFPSPPLSFKATPEWSCSPAVFHFRVMSAYYAKSHVNQTTNFVLL